MRRVVLKRLHKWLIKKEKWLKVFFWFSLIFCFLQTVLLADIPEIIRHGAKIGNYIAAICYSYIASYVFYSIALRVDRKNKKIYNIRAIKKALKLIAIFETILKKMGNQADLPYESESDIKTLLERTNPKSRELPYITSDTEGSLIKGHYSWAEYIIEESKKMKETYSQIGPFMTTIDSQLASAVDEIFDSEFFMMSDLVLTNINIFANSNLSCMEKGFIDVSNKVNNLKALIYDLKKLYGIN